MKVIVNGVPTELQDGATVSQVVIGLTEATSGVAVAIDGQVLSRSEWDRPLSEGQQVEVLKAVQGG